MTDTDTLEPKQDTVPAAPAKTIATTGAIDREQLCPFLLRMYYRIGQHHRVDDFSPTSTPPESSELRLYTWKNATLGEITSLIKQAIPDVIIRAGPGGRLSFRHIFLDTSRSLYVGKDIDQVRVDYRSEQGGISTNGSSTMTPAQRKGAERTLESFKFVIGDYLDIAITSSAPGFQAPRSQQSAFGGGPVRHGGGGRDGRQRGGPMGGGGGGGGRGGHRGQGWGDARAPADRLAGRLGGGGFGRNGHGQGSMGRQEGVDARAEPSWKGRGRGR